MLRIGTWNTEWTPPGKVRGELVRALLADSDCDILCVTEGVAEILPNGGHLIDAGSDWGCPVKNGWADTCAIAGMNAGSMPGWNTAKKAGGYCNDPQQ